jgi:hypothetical protein
LAQSAASEAAFRWHALTALASMTHVSALDALNDLLHAQSIETRYGAFRAIRTRNAAEPATKGELLDKKFRYHVIPTTGEPLVHVARSRKPEIVLFGHEQQIRPAKFLFAGREIMVTALDSGELKVGRFLPGHETQYETCPARLDPLIRTIVNLGGGYGDVIQCLQEAREANCLDGRLAVEALPRPNRKFYRDDDPLPEAPPDDGPSSEPDSGAVAHTSAESPGPSAGPPPAGAVRQAATPAPELFTDGIESGQARAGNQSESKATPGQPYVAPEYSQPKPGWFDKLNPLSRPTSPKVE